MVLIPYNNEPAPLSSSDGDLHLDKHALRLEALPPGTRDSGFGASTASDMEALGQPADLSPCSSEDITSFRAVATPRRPLPTEAAPPSGVSSFLSPPASIPDGKNTVRNDLKCKKPPLTLPKSSEAPLVPPKPSNAPVVPPKPPGAPVIPPKPSESPVLPPKPAFQSTPQKPVVPKKPDILDFSKQSADLPGPGCPPMKLVLEELSKEVVGKSLKTSEQRSAVIPDNPAPPALSPGHVPDDVTIDMECPKVETKFPNSFVASKKKSSKGISQSSHSSAFHQVGTSTKSRHAHQASIVSNTSSDTSCSELSSSFSSTFRQEDSASQEVKDTAGEGEEDEETDPAVPAPMPQLSYIRANHRQRLYGRSSGSSSSGSGQSLRSANIPISTPLLLHTPLPDSGGAGSGGLRHFPLFHQAPNTSDHPKPSQLSLRNHHSQLSQQQQQQQSPHGLPSPSSSVSSGASSSKDHASTPLLQQHIQQHGQQAQHLHQHRHHHHPQQQHQEEDWEEKGQQEVPDYNAVGASTCENCALGKCQTVYLHMPGRFHNYSSFFSSLVSSVLPCIEAQT